ncbi:MAG: Lrp/AsnC family transcriptional regulator [DPANN group archaeon]|nr:Lrp/AsnC family transcriptional regulator [DPANN group archaeon]
MLKEREKKVFFELLKDGRVHDKAMSKKLGITQPTITRIRQRLEKKGYIKGYCAVPAFEKIGITLMAITLFTWKGTIENYIKASKLVKSTPQIISVSSGEGLRGKNGMIISAHLDFKSYESFIRSLKEKCGNDVINIEQFFFSVDNQFVGFNFASSIITALSKS